MSKRPGKIKNALRVILERMDHSIRIRRATRNDREALIQFNKGLAAETEDTRLSQPLLSAGVDAVLDDSEKGFYFVADVDGVSVGGLLITTEWSDWRNAYFWWIQSVYVEPAHRKRGVYSCLHEHVIREAKTSGDVCGVRLYVDRDNDRARRTYERLGMSRARYDLYEVPIGENTLED